MLTILMLLVAFVILAIAARFWGKDSTEALLSCEWLRRTDSEIYGSL